MIRLLGAAPIVVLVCGCISACSASDRARDEGAFQLPDSGTDAVAGDGAGAGGITVLATGEPHPTNLAIDSASVYWTNFGGGAVRKVALDGSALVTLFSPTSGDCCVAGGVAVAGASVFWIGAQTVWRIDAGGGTADSLATLQNAPARIATDGAFVYWTNSGSGPDHGDGAVMQVAATGGVAVTLAAGQHEPVGIAVRGNSVYWTTVGTYSGSQYNHDGAVMKLDLAGGTPTALATAQDNPRGIAVDASSVYWTNSAYATPTVMKVATAGGTPVALATDTAAPTEIAIDAAHVYWTSYYGGTVKRVPVGGGTPTTLAAGQDTPEGIAVDDASVYWTNDFGGTIVKTPKP